MKIKTRSGHNLWFRKYICYFRLFFYVNQTKKTKILSGGVIIVQIKKNVFNDCLQYFKSEKKRRMS